jgi:hypothetical protein
MRTYVIVGVLLFGVLISISACSNTDSDRSIQHSESVIELTPRLIIGLEDYHDDYSFGAISDVGFLSDGRIAVLDRIKCKASVYSPAGEFMYAIGGKGDGPGEFRNPDELLVRGQNLVILEGIYRFTE